MKNYLKIAGILGAIALVCAAILAGINMLTASTIAANNTKAQNDTLNTITATVEGYNKTAEATLPKDGKYKASGAEYTATISYAVELQNEAGTKLGNIYTLSGANAYGTVKIMVCTLVKNDTVVVHQVELLDNGQSFASTVDAFVKSTFISSESSSVEGGFTASVTKGTEEYSDVSGINVKCGATYGATLVRDLTNAALQYAKEAK